MAGSVLPIGLARRPTVTKDRILDAAESLFMEHGFEATSLRAITAAAGVNLASVNYHFGSKEELFQAVLTRRLDPMNQERLDLLTKLERESGPAPLRVRSHPVGDVRPGAAARARPGARRQEFPPPARARLRRSRAVHPSIPGRAIRDDDRALQDRVRKGAPGSAEEGALVAPAFHHGRAVVHARGHRCACASSPSSRRRRPATTRRCCSGSPRSCSPDCSRRWPMSPRLRGALRRRTAAALT